MKSKIATIIIFVVILLSLPIVTILMPKNDFSEVENRYLAKWPKFSIDNIIDRDYMNGIEDYVSDHFILRDGWVSMKSSIEYLTGKRENNGVFIGDDALIENIAKPNLKYVESNINGIIDFYNKTGKKSYIMLVPTALEIWQEKLPSFAEGWSQRDFIKDTVKKLEDVTSEIDVYKVLYEHSDEYIYYRTDHHWTSYGAYLAYREMASALYLNQLSLNDFDIKTKTYDFNGTLYSKSSYRNTTPDRIDAYELTRGNTVTEVLVNNGAEEKSYSSIYFDEFLDKKDKYSYFLGTNEPIVTIKTNVVNGRKLLVFKDSFSHTYSQFLLADFEEIVLVDLRYLNIGVDKYIDIETFDTVMFLYNVDTFASTADIGKLSMIS